MSPSIIGNIKISL